MSAANSMSFGEKAKQWGVAVRAFSFPASIVPVILGSAYAFYTFKTGVLDGSFNWLLFVLALIAGMLYHIGCNLINDYYDFKHGLDREGAFGGSGVLVAGSMTPKEVMTGAWVTLVLGSLIGLYLYSVTGIELLYIGIAGFLAAIFYTMTPLSAKYAALGGPLVFLMMGVLMVLGAYYVQTGSLGWEPVWVSLPIAFIVTAILQANDTRDIADDREAGIRTAGTLLGPTGARAYYSFLVFAPYAVLIGLAVAQFIPWWSLLALVTLPLAVQQHSVFWKVRDERHEDLHPTIENTAKLHMGFGLLMTIGLIVGGFTA